MAKMDPVKMVITGPFNAGKTQFIRSISEIEPVLTDAPTSAKGEKDQKDETTVAMDFGRITVDDELILYLFGTPGQRRFDFMWEILSEGMLGFVVLVDSSRPETFREAKSILETFRAYAPTPYVVAANKQDMDDAWEIDDLRIALRLDEKIKLLPCIAKDEESVKETLLALLYAILEELGEEVEEEEAKASVKAGHEVKEPAAKKNESKEEGAEKVVEEEKSKA